MYMNDTEYQKFKDSRFYGYFDLLKEEIARLGKMGVKFLFFQTPLRQNIKNLSEFEQQRLDHWEFDFNHITDRDCEMIGQIYPPEVTTDYLQQVYDGSRVYEKNGIKYLADFSSRYVNVIMGHRITMDCPQQWNNTIYLFGQCTARGTGVEDKHTIASFLQRQLNQNGKSSYRVMNMAVGCGSDLYDDIMHMRETDFRSGDLVILCTNLEIVPLEEFRKNNIAYYDTSFLFDRPHAHGEWFTDMTFHTNAAGNSVIATYIYDVLEKRSLLIQTKEKPPVHSHRPSQDTDDCMSEDLRQYIQSLSENRKEGKNGCIVMNCNPFTLGHQYLVEYASKKVDHLYLFVVEEDKSFFPFRDRLELVKKGVEKFANVEVLPSGRFIISAYTFPGYFLKDGNKEIEMDASMDVEIFGKYIAKALDIRVRFVGEEPNDYVTRMYNDQMRTILPEYGVELEIIKRKENRGEVVSASRVRALLKQHDFAQIREIVPETTYTYLMQHYQ